MWDAVIGYRLSHVVVKAQAGVIWLVGLLFCLHLLREIQLLKAPPVVIWLVGLLFCLHLVREIQLLNKYQLG